MSKKGKVVTFMNMKGGVAKTTLCINIAHTLSIMEKRVLLIDMDPQFNATQTLITKYKKQYPDLKRNKKTIFYLFEDPEDMVPNYVSGEDTKYEKPVEIITKLDENFDIICGDLELIRFENESGKRNRLNTYIKENNLKEVYDYILIDSPPTYSFYSVASILASDCYLLPIKPDYYSMLGVDLVKYILTKIRKDYGKYLHQVGVIYTFIKNSTVVHDPIIKKLSTKDKVEYVFEKKLKDSVEIVRGSGKGILMYELPNQIKSNIEELTKEFISRMEDIYK
ncbi:ParA family protein [Aeribacillus pallidus]|jgi:chromosome partitioning protein|uniref:ParA family protein n=1 Tax=Aeribacillus pallidus TaxID=33936 RepID=UPI000E350350|nr:ParA family protein [Aeribacillus pallidus]